MKKYFRSQKYCYWVDVHGFEKMKEDLGIKGIQLIDETRIPCRVLRTSIEIGFVAPSAWNGFCKRRTSWYWKSEKARKFLIVSNGSLDFPDLENPIVIKESNFKPKRFPLPEEIIQLALELSEWDRPDPAEKDFYQRWFERHQVNEPFDFDRVLKIHSANHANFLDPKYFVTVDGVRIPYSIADSIHTCSSCLEFFNIIGNKWAVKYVIPCIGAVQFAHLPVNKYFEVIIQNIA